MKEKFKARAAIGQMTLRGHRVIGTEMVEAFLVINKVYRDTGRPLTFPQIAKLCKISDSAAVLRVRKLVAFGLVECDANHPRNSIVPSRLSWIIEPTGEKSATNADREDDLHATEQGRLGCWSVQNESLQGDLRTVSQQGVPADQP